MEKMATDVKVAIDGTMFNKEPIRCFRGVGIVLFLTMTRDSSTSLHCAVIARNRVISVTVLSRMVYMVILSKTGGLKITSQEVTLMTTAP